VQVAGRHAARTWNKEVRRTPIARGRGNAAGRSVPIGIVARPVPGRKAGARVWDAVPMPRRSASAPMAEAKRCVLAAVRRWAAGLRLEMGLAHGEVRGLALAEDTARVRTSSANNRDRVGAIQDEATAQCSTGP